MAVEETPEVQVDGGVESTQGQLGQSEGEANLDDLDNAAKIAKQEGQDALEDSGTIAMEDEFVKGQESSLKQWMEYQQKS